MDVGYILLNRSWLVENDVLYDDQSNTYQLSHEEKKIKLLFSKSKPEPVEQKLNAPNKSNEISMISTKDFPQEMEKDTAASRPNNMEQSSKRRFMQPPRLPQRQMRPVAALKP